jgi:hypothetical protein
LKIILILFASIILASCYTTDIDLFRKCTWSADHLISSEEEAIKVATDFIKSNNFENELYLDSVEVWQILNDSTIYEISFKKKAMELPPNILFFIRKSDGCLVQALLD